MINITQGDWKWDILDNKGQCPRPDVWFSPAERLSIVLGPDGEPLQVGYQRPRMGFDLRPRE